MKIIKVNILLCLLALVLGSCEDFLESRDKGQVLEEKLFVNIESNNIKGTCEIIAKQNNLKRYFFRFLV